jgi:glycosyltransferase involved in cell wall biosynthesis
MKKVVIITSFPRIQRVDVYNEMQKNKEYKFNVFYLRSMPYGRHWEYGPKLEHKHLLIKEWRLWKHLYLSPSLLKRFIDYKPDIMIMTQYASPGMQLLMYYCSLRKIPWIFWAEAPHVRYETPFIKNKFLRAFLRTIAMLPIRLFAKEVWGVGGRAVNEYQDEFGFKKIYKNLPYYSNLEPFFKAETNRKDMIPTFLFSGSLSYRKGADLFVDSIKKLSNSGYKFNVIVMGIGEFQDDFIKLQKINKIQVSLLGFVQLDKVSQVYSQANILVFPSRHDGWGMTLPEGMASGMCVISTPYVGCSVDTLENYKNGIVIDTNNSYPLANAMKYLIQHPGRIAEMGSYAKKTISQYSHFNGAKKFNSMILKSLKLYV